MTDDSPQTDRGVELGYGMFLAEAGIVGREPQGGANTHGELFF